MTGEEMRKPPLKKKQKRTRKSSDVSPTSFLSLPYDVAFNCLARVSRTNHLILSLVSKRLRSLMALPDLEATRSRIGKTEKCLCVCLNLNNKPSWYILSSTPKQKLIPFPSFPYQYPNYSDVVSIGSDIYIIGGTVLKGNRSKRVYLLDCKAYQWRRLPNMCIARKEAYADVIDGKIYVSGGCNRKYKHAQVWHEFYDPETQTWEPGCFKGAVSMLDRVRASGKGPGLYTNFCLVEIKKNEWCRIRVNNGELVYCFKSISWHSVAGLEEMSSSSLISVTNSSGGGRRVTVWWKTVDICRKMKIWCAEISLERRRSGVIWGVVEWSQNVFTFPGRESVPQLVFGQTAIVTYDC